MKGELVENIMLFAFLVSAVWQDIKSHSVARSLYLFFGIFGMILAILYEKNFGLICCSVGIGVLLLVFGHLLEGGIGEGDGWFFTVTGLYLSPGRNFLLLASGLFFCGLYSLILTAAAFGCGANIRKLRIPFLPFLLPGGLWMVLL